MAGMSGTRGMNEAPQPLEIKGKTSPPPLEAIPKDHSSSSQYSIVQHGHLLALRIPSHTGRIECDSSLTCLHVVKSTLPVIVLPFFRRPQ
jgi:hypothetical protein